MDPLLYFVWIRVWFVIAPKFSENSVVPQPATYPVYSFKGETIHTFKQNQNKRHGSNDQTMYFYMESTMTVTCSFYSNINSLSRYCLNISIVHSQSYCFHEKWIWHD